MITPDPMRTMRDEMAEIVTNREHVTLARIERWGITLDAHLAVKRCPECGTLEQPFVSYNVRAEGPYSWTMCGSMHCDRQTEGANDAEAVAKFYEGVTP